MSPSSWIRRARSRARGLIAASLLATACGAVPPVAAITDRAIAAPAAEAPGPRDGEPVSIGTTRVLRSPALGEDRPLYVCLPEDYEGGTSSYPVLFVLYGDQVRGYFGEAVNVVHQLSEDGRMPPMIVVGVVNVDRYRDLSPVGRQGAASGIEPFSWFVAEELVPFVEREYRTKGFRALVGPQAGAEFALHTLATRPELFHALIVENPFRSTEVHGLLSPMIQDRMRSGFPSATFLQITTADRAGPLDMAKQMEWARSFEKSVSDMRPRNLTLVTHYVEKNEDWLVPLRLKEGLRELFRDYPFPAGREVRGLADITGHYAALSKRLGFDADVPERTLALRADELGRGGAVDSAKIVLEYLIRTHPRSVDGHWRLANLHRAAGNHEEAIEHYRKCLEVMPNMGPARDWIEKLRAKQ